MDTDRSTIRISVRNLVEFVMRGGVLTIAALPRQKKMPCRQEAACTGKSRSARARIIMRKSP